MKILNLVWTNEALNRLSEIDEYISQDSVTRARKFINNLIKSTSTIPQYPQRGRIVPEFGVSDIRELIHNNYRIVYRVKKDQVQILTVFEAHRLIRTHEIIQK